MAPHRSPLRTGGQGPGVGSAADIRRWRRGADRLGARPNCSTDSSQGGASGTWGGERKNPKKVFHVKPPREESQVRPEIICPAQRRLLAAVGRRLFRGRDYPAEALLEGRHLRPVFHVKPETAGNFRRGQWLTPGAPGRIGNGKGSLSGSRVPWVGFGGTGAGGCGARPGISRRPQLLAAAATESWVGGGASGHSLVA